MRQKQTNKQTKKEKKGKREKEKKTANTSIFWAFGLMIL